MTMDKFRCRAKTRSEEETAAFAQQLAAALAETDVVALVGKVGSGKSVFARALISALLAEAGRVEDIPSPTYTLVQTYEARFEIWHVDLYRLDEPREILELGLQDAFGSMLCVVEWGDRIAEFLPGNTVRVELEPVPGCWNSRIITVNTSCQAVAARIEGIQGSHE